jgi:hypothetical protein
MDDAEFENLFEASKDWIKTRAEQRAVSDPECFCSTAEHPAFATENA